MLNYDKALESFENYIRQYDSTDDKIKLKIIHTFGVVECASYIAIHEKMNEEQQELAKIIALLHDIGRFEQLKQYHSFDDRNVDHASIAIEYLFKQGHIRDYIEEDQYDTLISFAIKNHSAYEIETTNNKEIKRQAYLIRDADKLDNFRVKNSEKIETLFDISMEQFEQEKLSTLIYDQVLNSQLIKKEDRVTSMDMWVSYLAFIFDLNYQSSFRYLLETNYLEENIDRISYKNKDTYKKMQLIKSHGYRYIRYHASLNTKI